MDEAITITWMGGVIERKEPRYWITSEVEGKWWWKREKYYLSTEFGKLGPFDSKGEIMAAAAMSGMNVEEILIRRSGIDSDAL